MAPLPGATPPLLAGLERGWVLLPQAVIGGTGETPVTIDVVLLHPARGVALLETPPHWTPDAPARFGGGRPGPLRRDLPRPSAVVHARLQRAALAGLPQRLAAGFEAQPPLDLAGGDAWMLAVRRALTSPATAADAAQRGSRGAAIGLAGLVLASALGGAVLVLRPTDPGPSFLSPAAPGLALPGPASPGKATAPPSALERLAEAVTPAEAAAAKLPLEAAVLPVLLHLPDAGPKGPPPPDRTTPRPPNSPRPRRCRRRRHRPSRRPPSLRRRRCRICRLGRRRSPCPRVWPCRQAWHLPALRPQGLISPGLVSPGLVSPGPALQPGPRTPAAPRPHGDALATTSPAEEPHPAQPAGDPQPTRQPRPSPPGSRPPRSRPRRTRLPPPHLHSAGVASGRAAAPPAADPALLAGLLRRGDALLALGDVSAARRFFERAAEAGSAAGARAAGRTHDPAVLAALGVRGIRPDPEAAAAWYRRADALAAQNTRCRPRYRAAPMTLPAVPCCSAPAPPASQGRPPSPKASRPR